MANLSCRSVRQRIQDGDGFMRAVIFDMDGVIFDSERIVYELWLELSEKYGFPDLRTPYWNVIGVNARQARETFLDFYGHEFPYDFYKAEQSRLYHERYDGGRLPLKEGVRPLLHALREAKIYTALASSTRTDLVVRQLADAGLLDYFSFVVGGDQVVKSKPEPEIFLRALAGTDISPAETVVIEDSFNGIRAASRAGMRPIMVPDLLPPDMEMKNLAEAILDDLRQVQTYLGL